MKGYFQSFKVEFNQTFVVVIKPIIFRVFFTIAALFDLDINQIDIKTDFLHNLMKQLIFIEMLKGSETKVNQDIICKLLKAFYSLKQSPYL